MAAIGGADKVLERAHLRALKNAGLGLGIGGDDDRHDRLPLYARSKGDFRPRITSSKS